MLSKEVLLNKAAFNGTGRDAHSTRFTQDLHKIYTRFAQDLHEIRNVKLDL